MIFNPAAKMKQLLGDLNSKKMTLEETLRECAYWYLDCFDEIHKKPYPSMPHEYRDYLELAFEKKQKISQEFWFQPKIKSYLDMKAMITHENSATLAHLKDHLSHIPPEDFLARSRFTEKIREFEAQDFG